MEIGYRVVDWLLGKNSLPRENVSVGDCYIVQEVLDNGEPLNIHNMYCWMGDDYIILLHQEDEEKDFSVYNFRGSFPDKSVLSDKSFNPDHNDMVYIEGSNEVYVYISDWGSYKDATITTLEDGRKFCPELNMYIED